MIAALLILKTIFLPILAVVALIAFRGELRDLLRRTVRIRLWGAELEAVPPEGPSTCSLRWRPRRRRRWRRLLRRFGGRRVKCAASRLAEPACGRVRRAGPIRQH